MLARGALNSVLIELEALEAQRAMEQGEGLFASASDDAARVERAGPDRAPPERAPPERAIVSRWALRALPR